jgi:hypothetical protein
VSEVNPDQIAKLAQLTPAAATDPAGLLFAAAPRPARTGAGRPQSRRSRSRTPHSVPWSCCTRPTDRPSAPNLFWPLLDLPTPFIDLRKGREGDMLFLTKEYDLLRKAVPAAEADLQSVLKNMDAMDIGRSIDGKGGVVRPSAYYAQQAKDKDALAAATERLKGFGYKADELAKLPPLQLVMMDDCAQYRADLDDFLKWTNVPAWQVPNDLGQRKRSGPFGELLPGYLKVIQAKLRLQQVIAMLAVAEGVRAHAADNGGQLPAALDAVKLPLPADPVTGKPFRYELHDGKGIIRGTPPPGREKEPTFNRVYEVTVRK